MFKRILFSALLLLTIASCSKVSDLMEIATTENLKNALTEVQPTLNVTVEPDLIDDAVVGAAVEAAVETAVEETINQEEIVEQVVSDVMEDVNLVDQIVEAIAEVKSEFSTTLTPYSADWVDTGITVELGDTISLTANGSFMCTESPEPNMSGHTTIFGYVWEGYSPAAKDRPFAMSFKVGDVEIGTSRSFTQLSENLTSGKLVSPSSGSLLVKINSIQDISVDGLLEILLKKD